MVSPDKSDCEKARRIARYLMHRPRAVQVFHFDDESEQMQGFADADWAGERPEMKSHVRGFADVEELTVEIVVKYTEHDSSQFS